MKKSLKITVSVVLSAMCILLGIPTACATVTDDLLSKMTLEEKIGQMMTVDVSNYNGESFTIMEKEVADIVSSNALGGIILFSENLENTEQTVKLISDFQNAALSSRNKIPLFMSVDQEGGEVVRLKQGTSLPGNMALGATNSESDCEKAGDILGKELSALGFNMDFAPSMDINSNPLNPVIGLRSYSSDPELVGKLGVSTINGIQKNGVVAVVKHFPGHGDTSTDSHIGLPVVTKSLKELEKCEFVPFKKAIDSGIDVVMTAHIQFPQIEKTLAQTLDGGEITLPATLSKTIVTDILRNQLGFNGVVTTDALNMSAISENFGAAQVCVLAINAGVDMLLMPVSISSSESKVEISSLIGNIASAVKNGIVQEETINNAVRRILTLKQKRGILNYKAPDATKAVKIVGSVENHETEDDIATSAVTLLKNDNILPVKPDKGQKAVFVTAYPDEMTNCQFAMSKLIAKGKVPQMEYETYCYNEGNSADEILSAVDSADYVFVFTEMNSPLDITPESVNTSVPKSVIAYAKEQNKPCVVISTGNPYDVANYTDVPALLVAYGCQGMDSSDTDGSQPATYTYGPNIMASIEVVFGYKNPFGVLPVDVPVINADGSMNLNEMAFRIGAGMTYPGTSKAEEVSQPMPTEIKIDVSDEVAPKIDNRSIIQKLKDDGSFPVVVLLSVAVIIVIVVLIAIVSGRKSRKEK